MRHCDHLKKTRAQQSVYAQSSDSTVVTASIREVIATLDEQIAQVERKIRQHFDDHPDLKRRRDLLTSIPGIGETTAGSILSEIPHLDRFESAKAVAAFAGLSPRERQSGTSIHGRPPHVQDRQRSHSQSSLHAGDGGSSMQSDSPDFRRATISGRKAQATHHRSRHAKATGPRLRDSSIGRGFRSKLRLTQNTVSIPEWRLRVAVTG